jgi:hypothetical protein
MASACRAAIAALIVIVGATTIALTQAPPPPPNQQTPAAAPTAESVKKAEQALADARKALGGDKLAELKTLVASGRTKRVRGNNLVPIEFEILIELPAKYVRVDEFPAEDTDPTSAGFNGDALIQIPPPPAMPAGRGGPPDSARGGPLDGARGGPTGAAPGAPPGGPPSGAPAGPPAAAAPPGATPPSATPPAGATPPTGATPPAGVKPPAGAMPPASAMPPGGMPPGGRGPAMDPRRARLNTVKQDYARLALGLFAASSAYPLTFSYAAAAEAPQGRADVLDAKGEGNFTLRYFIHSETRLPVMVTWTTPPTNVIVTVPGQPPPATVAPGAVVVAGPPAPPKDAPKEEMDKYSKEVLAIRAKAQATPVENRLYFADYRDVDGLKLPFRLRRAIGTETTEETTFDRFRINAKIDQRKFEPLK